MSGVITANSDVGICSEALISLGNDPIADFEENTDAARACSNLYASTRDDLLRRHPWNSCITRSIGTPDTVPPAWGYSKRFPLPSNCLRLLGVVVLDAPAMQAAGAAGIEPYYTTDFTLENGAVLCNYPAIGFHYIYRNDNVAQWGPGLVRMMILRMRWALAFPITRDLSVETLAAQTFAAELKTYKTLDGSETPGYMLADGDYLTSRL